MLCCLIAVLLWFSPPAIAANNACDLAEDRATDDLRVFLVTLSPGRAVWSTFGHSTIWVSDGKKDLDESYNWGTFDPNEPNLLASYLNGTLLYWLNVEPYIRDLYRYNEIEDRTIVAQRLMLPPKALNELVDLISEERKPENRKFVYHWREKSCATIIRDHLDNVMDGQLGDQWHQTATRSLRDEALRHLWTKPLIWFGWTFLAGHKVDGTFSDWSLMYSPVLLKEAVTTAKIRWPDGEIRALSPYACKIVGELGWAPDSPPNHNIPLGLIGVFWGGFCGMGVRFMGMKRHRQFLSLSMLMLAISAGTLGTIHAILYWSALDVMHPNANQLLCNPLLYGWFFACLPLWRGNALWAHRLTGCAFGLSAMALLLRLSPWGIQDNTPMILLFVPLYAGLWWGVRKHPIK